MCPESECVLASSGKLHGWWGFFWKFVQYVSVFWILLASCMANEAPSENVSSLWVCSGFFLQAAWLIRLLLKMCPASECVLASSCKLHGWRGSFQNVSSKWVCSGYFWQARCWSGSFWKCLQQVRVFWPFLVSQYLMNWSENVLLHFKHNMGFNFFFQAVKIIFLSPVYTKFDSLFNSLYVYFPLLYIQTKGLLEVQLW